jgi:hypothetical protein
MNSKKINYITELFRASVCAVSVCSVPLYIIRASRVRPRDYFASSPVADSGLAFNVHTGTDMCIQYHICMFLPYRYK